MKKQLCFTLMVLFSFLLKSNAQWSPLNSTTTANLHDVDFISSSRGVIVGDTGTILLSNDGGASWNSINSHIVNGDVYSVRMISTDSIVVSTFDHLNAIASIYLTADSGLTWNIIHGDSSTNHQADLETINLNSLFAVGSYLKSTVNAGTSWDTLANFTGGQTSLDLIRFADNKTGHVSGLVSGFVTYSASFLRTEDGGTSWYASDPFSFSNDDALTTMCFSHPDTALMFTNHYTGFIPGPANGLVKLYDFNQYIPFPGDTEYQFTSQVINSNTPAYMNDAYFMNSTNMFATGQNGNIYHSADEGLTWTINFAGTNALVTFNFIDGTGYAVGENGTLIKYSATTGISTHGKEYKISLYPNPVSNQLIVKIENYTSSKFMSAEINSINGQFIKKVKLFDNINSIDVSALPAGAYELILNLGESRAPEHLPWVKN